MAFSGLAELEGFLAHKKFPGDPQYTLVSSCKNEFDEIIWFGSTNIFVVLEV